MAYCNNFFQLQWDFFLIVITHDLSLTAGAIDEVYNQQKRGSQFSICDICDRYDGYNGCLIHPFVFLFFLFAATCASAVITRLQQAKFNMAIFRCTHVKLCLLKSRNNCRCTISAQVNNHLNIIILRSNFLSPLLLGNLPPKISVHVILF